MQEYTQLRNSATADEITVNLRKGNAERIAAVWEDIPFSRIPTNSAMVDTNGSFPACTSYPYVIPMTIAAINLLKHQPTGYEASYNH
jgi:hypothetical protein